MTELEVFAQGKKIGTAEMEREGLFLEFSANLRPEGDALLRLYAVAGWHSEYLGIPCPSGGELRLSARLPASHFPGEPTAIAADPRPRSEWLPWCGELDGIPVRDCRIRREQAAIVLALAEPAAVLRGATRVAVLENVMNPTNLGAIFRSAAALGMDAVLLTSAGSDPLYRRAIRVSMGTVFQVPWAYVPEDWPALLRAQGFRTAAMALRDDSVRLDDPRLTQAEKLAVVMGTEGDGLADATIAACDFTVRIPMHHGVDSLNVAAASAVAFYQLGRRA